MRMLETRFRLPVRIPVAPSAAHVSRALPPRAAPPDRGVRVIRAVREDNAALIETNPSGARAKLAALAESPFRFFRGTAGLYYRGLEGRDIGQPEVTVNGDVHPENFAVMQGADGELFFGPNDFDEATRAPFTWDLRRGATAFDLAAR